jgi:hypothetical protein
LFTNTELLKIFLAAFFGLIIGSSLRYIGNNLLFIFRRGQKTHLMREWQEYHLVYKNGAPILKHESWKIKRGISQEMSVETKDTENDKYKFRGAAWKEGKFAMFQLKSITPGHDEEFYCRFNWPIVNNDSEFFGIWLGLDLDGSSVSGTLMLSKQKISEEKAIMHLQENTSVNDEFNLLRLSSGPASSITSASTRPKNRAPNSGQ